ncbi:hypothetical protein PROFUN_11160 [Planoprotostelium fungivorum]|uniref:Arginyl-tRNA--protein transferase 1 n=1 Tax=Planoprotostelium fungivorum TaxID=1890364 RepID=A0A2P6NAM4_9EUKA|nr:hypothetical protein PROFUN_11160 [Planoprotostelium fungivorum]
MSERIQELLNRAQNGDESAMGELQSMFFSEENEDVPQSVIRLGQEYSSKCGYCDTRQGSTSYGMTAESLTVTDYQQMIDRGWRRSGGWMYYPNRKESCCCLYTIRLDVNAFVASRNQHKVINRMNRYLATGVAKQPPIEKTEQAAEKDIKPSVDVKEMMKLIITSLEKVAQKNQELGAFLSTCEENWRDLVKVAPGKMKIPGNFACNIAVVLEGLPVGASDLAGSLCDELMASGVEGCTHENGFVNLQRDKNEPREIENKKKKQKTKEEKPTEKKHELIVQLIDSEFDEEEYQVYKRYQMSVHGDKESKLSEASYTNFLCHSPLIYRLDGKLIAVGVVDVLPSCLSSVYFFYDPDYSFLEWGVFSALSEIDWVKKCGIEGLHHYYMGYYIQTCPKMKYKGQYKPSELLCPYSLTWQPLSQVVQLIEREPHAKLSDVPDFVMDESEIEETKKNVTLLLSGRPVRYKDITKAGKQVLDKILPQIIHRVGPKLSQSLHISRIAYVQLWRYRSKLAIDRQEAIS